MQTVDTRNELEKIQDVLKNSASQIYLELFSYRDSLPENPLRAPANYPLDVLLNELKWGRPAAQQKWLDEKIEELRK